MSAPELTISVNAHGDNRWLWSVINPHPFLPHPNHVAHGRTWTYAGAWRAGRRAARRELRRIARYERRRAMGEWRTFSPARSTGEDQG